MLRKSLTVATVVGAGSQAVAVGFRHAMSTPIMKVEAKSPPFLAPVIIDPASRWTDSVGASNR